MDYRIVIKEPFQEKYTLTIDSDMLGVSVHMVSKIQIRWDFRVIRIDEVQDQMEIELIQLDNVLLEANNPLIKEMAAVSRVFGKMYSELHLIIDRKGKILDVLNMDLILGKWKHTKAEMKEAMGSSPDIQNAISLNDSIFQDTDKLKAGIQASEFFSIYFGEVYGEYLPSTQKKVAKTNFFNTANIHWAYSIFGEKNMKYDGNTIKVYSKAEPSSLTPGFNNRAYNQFANQLDIATLDPILKEESTYLIQPRTGKLMDAILSKEEIANHDLLYTKMHYRFISDTSLAEKNNLRNKPVFQTV